MREATVWWRVPQGSSREENAAALTEAVRTVHPGAPEVTEYLAYPLLGRRQQILILGDDGSEMILTKGEVVNSGNVRRFEITVQFTMTDYGLGEFDDIMQSMSLSAPVAAAIETVRAEESDLPPLAEGAKP